MKEVRTIKTTDAWIYESVASKMVADSKYRSSKDIDSLAILLPQRKRELIAELQSPKPNMARIASLRCIVDNLQHTLNSIQR